MSKNVGPLKTDKENWDAWYKAGVESCKHWREDERYSLERCTNKSGKLELGWF